jgi:hypothetical protein
MKTLGFLSLIVVCLFGSRLTNAQQFSQSSSAPLTAPKTGDVIDETGAGASVHSLSWTTVGAPTSCTIAIEMSSTAAGPFTLMGSQQSCIFSGSIALSGITANFVRINLSSFAGAGASLTYIYGATGTVGSAVFASASLWAKLDALRAVEALKHGIPKVNHCPLFTPGPSADAVPYPTNEEFQLYSEPFGSSLNIAASFGDTGANGIPSAKDSIQTEALAQIQFESEHFFYDWSKCISHRPTFSFGGAMGFVPALVLENLTSTTQVIAKPNNRPMFQDAFAWNLSPKMNIVTSHTSQLSVVGTIGQTYLISQVTSFKQGDNTVTATPVSNNVGQSAFYWETGVQWKLLNTDIVNAYINKTDVLNPPFDVSFGYRHDGRFKQAGDLATFSNPQAYLFFRFNVGLNKIVNWNSATVSPGKGYTFKFGIDYERPISDSKMPSATRYYVSANFDIMQLFKPSAQPAAQPAPGAAPSPVPSSQQKAPHAIY